MKRIRQILSVTLVLILALVLAVPTFAAGAVNDGIIQINNAWDGKTYKAYCLFDLNLSQDGTRYSYSINADWKNFFTTGKGKEFISIDPDNGNVTLKSDTADDLQKLAAEAKTYAEANAVRNYTATGTAPTLTFSNLPLGYYLVTTDAGALQALDTTNKNAVIYEKNAAPKIDKSANHTNAAYGETVHFTIPVTRGGYVWGDYVIRDTMNGLVLKEDTIKLSVNNTPLTKGNDYTVTPMDNTLTVTIPEKTLNKRNDSNTDFVYPAGTQFVLEYDAVAKQTVSMENKVVMDYKTNPSVTIPDGKTPEHIVKVANYEFIVKKTDERDTVLNGAVFELHTQEDCADKALEFIKTGENYRLAEANETAGEGSEKTSKITAGNAKIEGLAAGTYYLKEITAPAHYNKLVNPVKIEIIAKLNSDTQSQYSGQAFDNLGNRLKPTIKMNNQEVSAEGADFVVTIINRAGTELPSTGGMGTTVFYVIGGLLMTAALVALIAKKRMAR